MSQLCKPGYRHKERHGAAGGDAVLCQTRGQPSNLSASSPLSRCRTATMTGHEWTLSPVRHEHHQHSSLFSPYYFCCSSKAHWKYRRFLSGGGTKGRRRKVIWVGRRDKLVIVIACPTITHAITSVCIQAKYPTSRNYDFKCMSLITQLKGQKTKSNLSI